jgi:hypothetical protein
VGGAEWVRKGQDGKEQGQEDKKSDRNSRRRDRRGGVAWQQGGVAGTKTGGKDCGRSSIEWLDSREEHRQGQEWQVS